MILEYVKKKWNLNYLIKLPWNNSISIVEKLIIDYEFIFLKYFML